MKIFVFFPLLATFSLKVGPVDHGKVAESQREHSHTHKHTHTDTHILSFSLSLLHLYSLSLFFFTLIHSLHECFFFFILASPPVVFREML